MQTALVSCLIATHMEAMCLSLYFQIKVTHFPPAPYHPVSTLCPLSLISLPPHVGEWSDSCCYVTQRFCPVLTDMADKLLQDSRGGGKSPRGSHSHCFVMEGVCWQFGGKVLWLLTASFWSFGSCLLVASVTSSNQKGLLTKTEEMRVLVSTSVYSSRHFVSGSFT